MPLTEVTTLQTNSRVERKYMATFANVATSTTPEWQLLGVRVADSSIDFNADIDETTDILGRAYADFTNVKPTQDMGDFPVIIGSKLHKKLMQIIVEKNWSALQGFEILNVYGWLTNGTSTETDKKLLAEKQVDCTITPDSIGGDTNVNLPITIHYSNNVTVGTVDKISEDLTFTAAPITA